MSALKRALAFTAMLSLLLTNGRVVHAFPTQPVIDSFWSSSMPWIVIPSRGNGTLTLQVSLNAPDCSDPVATRNSPASRMCPTAPTRDVVVHVFTEGVGAPNEVLAWRCLSPVCTETIELPATASQRIAVMVHGGPTAVGRQNGILSWNNGVSQGFPEFSLAGNLMVDVSNPPATNYDAETVLMPDVGNLPNDDLGADVTEMWALRDDFRVIRADVEGSGVGDAGRIALAATPPLGSSATTRWVMVRPAKPLPFQVRSEATYIPTIWPGPTLDPSAVHNTGRMRLILNARYGNDDADYDGLSNAVEQALGTCDGVNPFPSTGSTSTRCTLWSSFSAATNPTRFMDPRDTDGDGLSDAAEVLGSDRSNARDVDALGVGLSTMSVNTGVSETFPRWGFSPLHKDILVEIDMGIPGPNCTQALPRQGCYVDPVSGDAVTIPQRLNATGAVWPLENWMNSLQTWHDRFAVIPATRANNPDGIDGINVHFDVRSASVLTTGHGTRAAFNPFPSSLGSAAARPGLIIYIPNHETSGSTCSCGGLMNGPAPRHGGYATLATLNPIGGGQSGPGSYIVGGLADGNVPAHEHGHNLCLNHGGPYRRGGANPFAARATDGSALAARIDHDLESVAKLAHDSLMSYFFSPWQPFSLGARSMTPLPRDVGGTFGYPEEATFGGANTYTVDFWNYTHSRPARMNCSGPGNLQCTGADFNWDGVASGINTTSLAEAPGYWRGGLYSRVRFDRYWCTTEQFSQFQGLCCASSPRANENAIFCADGSTPAQPLVPATWLLSGQPAGFIGENRAYAVFVDDDLGSYSATGPEERARNTFNSTRPNGILRWAAFDGFLRSAGQSPGSCLGKNGCAGPPSGAVVGTVRVDNAPVTISGTTGISAATYREDGDEGRVTVLGWTTRTSRLCASPSACDSAWVAPRFAIARSSNFEAGMTSFTLPGSAPQLSNSSSVAIAAWDPAMGGQDRGFTIFLRGAASPYPVRWYTCWTNSGVPNVTNCTDRGTLWEYNQTTGSSRNVDATGSIAAAVDRPTSGAPSLYLARTRFNESLIRDQLALSRLRVMPGYVWVDGPIDPTQSNGIDYLPSITDASISMTIVPSDGLVSETTGGRMLLSWEFGRDTNIGYNGGGRIATRFGVPRTGLTGFLFDGWDTNGPRSNTPLLPSGGNSVTWTPGPGHVDALFFDGRSPNVVRGADTDLDPFLPNRARGFHVDMEQGAVVAQFIGVAEPHGQILSKANYDETMTLAYYTCQHAGWNQLQALTNQDTLHPTSRGFDVYFNALQRGAPLIPLGCPGAAAWATNNGAIGNTLTTINPNELVGEALSTATLLNIADFINRSNVFESTPSSPLTPPTPPTIRYDGFCFAGQSSPAYASGHAPVTPP